MERSGEQSPLYILVSGAEVANRLIRFLEDSFARFARNMSRIDKCALSVITSLERIAPPANRQLRLGNRRREKRRSRVRAIIRALR